MDRKRKLCIVAPGHWLDVMGGAQYQTMLLIQAVAATGRWDISYIARNVGKRAVSPEDHRLVKIHNPWNITGGLYLDAGHVLRALRREAPDLIYHRGSTAYSGAVGRYARESGARVIWHVASDADVKPWSPTLSRNVIRKALEWRQFRSSLRNTDIIVTQTSDQARLLKRNYGLDHTEVIYNFHPAPAEEIRKTDPPLVAWVGNFKPLKQPERFIAAAAALRDKCDARFVMVGVPQGSRKWMGELNRAIAATPNLEYRGGVSQEAVNELLAQASVLVNTSLYEGFSNTFIQAWMRGVPVVSLLVDPDGLLSKGDIGFHSGTQERLEADILRLVRDRELRERMGRQAREHAARSHSLANVDRLVSLMDRAVGLA